MIFEADANAAYLVSLVKKKLVGKRIIAPYLNTDGDFGFVVEDEAGKKLVAVVSRDAERNGMGWLHVGLMREDGVIENYK